MSLIIATGSNLGDREKNLNQAQLLLAKFFSLKAKSRIYQSAAQDYQDQPAFLNQVLEFNLPDQSPIETMQQLLDLEIQMGRVREKKYGPRIIDLDILFWDNLTLKGEHLTLPHPRWLERSFVVRPLLELPFAAQLKKIYSIPEQFSDDAIVFQK
ncbi:MAG: 2-amino-4-hydroxy-6-hydroxymethyldihydropteridine diphosphokinase [Bacteriovoracaceae bacterium]